ncbi:hypothetical protein D3C85_1280710 [compost metagenome]
MGTGVPALANWLAPVIKPMATAIRRQVRTVQNLNMRGSRGQKETRPAGPTPLAGFSCIGEAPPRSGQISTLVPNSTTRFAGIEKKSDGLAPF